MRRVLFVSGAGLSVESGIRAFRTDTDSGKAMWDEYDIEEVCDIDSFAQGFRIKTQGVAEWKALGKSGVNCYDLTHQFYNKRRVELATVEPNAAHLAISDIYRRFSGQVINFTTNVDDLLERAGVAHEDIIHAHGYLPEVIYKRDKFDDECVLVDIGHNEFNYEDFYWAKPNVVFFGESAPFYRGEINLFETLTAQDMVVVVGCSNQVINFNWEIFPALTWGCKMVVVNPNINYLEQELYEERGVLVYRAGAVETFTNKHFLNVLNKHLEG